MIDMTDQGHKPDREEIERYIGDPLFHDLYVHMEGEVNIPAVSKPITYKQP